MGGLPTGAGAEGSPVPAVAAANASTVGLPQCQSAVHTCHAGGAVPPGGQHLCSCTRSDCMPNGDSLRKSFQLRAVVCHSSDVMTAANWQLVATMFCILG